LVYVSETKDKGGEKSKSSSHKEGETPAKCWLYPQTKVRIISKDFKKGKYYNKKVRLCFITANMLCLNIQLSRSPGDVFTRRLPFSR